MNIEKRHSERRQDTFTNAMLNISSPNKKKTLYTFFENPYTNILSLSEHNHVDHDMPCLQAFQLNFYSLLKDWNPCCGDPGLLYGLFVFDGTLAGALALGCHCLSPSSSSTCGARGRLRERGGGTIVWYEYSSTCPVEMELGDPGAVLRGGGGKLPVGGCAYWLPDGTMLSGRGGGGF